MIYVRLKGGIGNQLFQYAAGRALAQRTGEEFCLDINFLERTISGVTSRKYELSHLRDSVSLIGESSLWERVTLKYIPRIYCFLKGINFIDEAKILNETDFKKLGGNCYLDGYWQRLDYFNEISSILELDLTTSVDLSEKGAEILRGITAQSSIAVHIRRGDYVTLKSAAGYHGSMSAAYYRLAINKICELVENPLFYVFSDDLSWAKSNLQISPGNSIFVDHNSVDNAWEDLMLMGHCKHHIISNSSFSWWGAWLGGRINKNSKQIVYAPDKWYRNKKISKNGRFPDHWIFLEESF